MEIFSNREGHNLDEIFSRKNIEMALQFSIIVIKVSYPLWPKTLGGKLDESSDISY